MTAHSISTVDRGTPTIPPTVAEREPGTPLLKKIHAIRPLHAERERGTKLGKVVRFPPTI